MLINVNEILSLKASCFFININGMGIAITVTLIVIARNSLGVYYKSCRRPDSDSDETRSRRSSGPKTKLETPLSTIRAHTWCPGASKVADFGRPKKPFFGQIFFLSNRTQMFAMPFS